MDPSIIEFRGVSFDYGDELSVLQSVDLHFAAGRSIGLVGRTGSGNAAGK